ncbi:synembryn-A isoform X2 [Hyalella azteca]|uniref:Synembryn-A isoform X2 n=1 Tax=Hyalella azteca TaxID=294128 RepID=A0A8B7NG34_HYAAZ|nr:synembryn-A isoform X2 [Hyalella azteca]
MDISKFTSATSEEETISILCYFNEKFASPSFNDAGKFEMSESQFFDTWHKLLFWLGSRGSEEAACTYLNTLRILSRDRNLMNQVVTEQDLGLLMEYAGLPEPGLEAVLLQHKATEACLCLSNIIYQSNTAQSICCSPHYVKKTLQRLQQQDLPHSLIVGYTRLMFLMTALVPQNRKVAALEYNALPVMLPLISAQASVNADNTSNPPPTMQREAGERVVEVLKLCYNLCVGLSSPYSSAGDGGGGSLKMAMVVDSSVSSEHEQHMRCLVDRVRQLLLATAHTHQHTQIMHSHCINVLVCVPTTALAALTPPYSSSGSWWGGASQRRKPAVFKDADMSALVQILSFLHARLNAGEAQSSENLTPVLTMLVTVCQSSSKVRQFVRQRVLPPLKDVTHRPEEGNSLRGRLVKLMTSPVMELKHLSATLLFVLCKQSVERLIKYSGYGNCAGLLASLGLLAGGELSTETHEQSESEDSDTEEYHRVRHMVNPVTGCYEPVRPNPMENMSEEQKEYEAIKLVNTLDKLIRSGDIKPCGVGADGKPQPLEHVMQLQDSACFTRASTDPQPDDQHSDSD